MVVARIVSIKKRVPPSMLAPFVSITVVNYVAVRVPGEHSGEAQQVGWWGLGHAIRALLAAQLTYQLDVFMPTTRTTCASCKTAGDGCGRTVWASLGHQIEQSANAHRVRSLCTRRGLRAQVAPRQRVFLPREPLLLIDVLWYVPSLLINLSLLPSCRRRAGL